MEEVYAILAANDSLFRNEYDQVECMYTGHTMPLRAETILEYLNGPCYAKASGKYREVEELIKDIGTCESLRRKFPSHYESFRELFQYHPAAKRKKVHKIRDISISWRPDNGGGPVFRIHYPWKGSDTISWRKCLLRYGRLSSTSPNSV